MWKLLSLKLTGFVLIAFLLTNCNLPKPAAPSWDIDLNIPLINKTYTIEEMVDDTDELNTDSLGNVYFEFDQELETFSAEDQLTLDGVNQNFSQTLGNFSIDSPGSENVDIEFRDIFPQADLLDGQQAIVPAFDIVPIDKNLPDYENFNWVEIESGFVTVEITNDLPIALGAPIVVNLTDINSGRLISSASFNSLIHSGETAVQQLDLSGQRLNSAIKVTVSGSSPGSSGELVEIDAGAGFTVDALFSDLTVSAASAKIPQQVITQSEQVVLEDSLVVTEAHIREGHFFIQLMGTIGADTQVKLTLPNFISSAGISYQDSVVVPAGGSNELSVDLNDYTLIPDGDDFGEQSVSFSWEVKTLHNPNESIIFNATDFFDASFQLEALYFSQIMGRFSGKWIDLPSQDFSLDIPESLDSLSFLNATLELTLFNEIGFPTYTDILLVGENINGESVEVMIQEDIVGSTDGSPVQNDIILTKSNSRIVELINIIPSTMKVEGRVRVGDPETEGVIRESDEVTGHVNFSAPLAFQLPAQEYEGDVSEVDIDDDIKDELDSKLNGGTLTAFINSHLPIGASLDMYFGETDSTVFSDPGLIIGPLAFSAGEIDPATGHVIAPSMSEIEISLGPEETNYFTNDSIYTGIKLTFPGTDGQIVHLLSTDYVHVQAVVRVQTHIEDDTNNN